MQGGIERFAGGVNFLQAGFGQNAPELLLDHGNAGLQGREFVGFGGLGRRLRHFKVVEHGQQFLQQGGAGGLRGLDAFARGAFLEVFKIGGGAQQAVPMLVGLGRAFPEGRQFFQRGFRGGDRWLPPAG